MNKKKILSLMMAATLFLGVTVFNVPLASAEASVQFYISPKGDDTEAGTIDFPFRTCARATQAVKEYINSNGFPSGGIDVVFREGTYNLGNSGYDLSMLSGEEGSPITYRAYENEEVIFDGSSMVSTDYINPVTDPALTERVSQEAKGKIYEVNLSDIYVDAEQSQLVMFYSGSGNRWQPGVEFYLNENAMTNSRWPKNGKASYGLVESQGDVVKENPGMTPTIKGASFIFEDEHIKNWKDYHNVFMHGSWAHAWAQHSIELNSYDPDTKIISSDSEFLFGIRDAKDCYFYNIFEEVKEPGDFYVDIDNNKLYFMAGDIKENIRLSYSGLNGSTTTGKGHFGIFSSGSDYITIKDITVQNVAGDAIVIQSGATKVPVLNPQVINCTVRNCGGNAIFVGQYKNALITDNIIYNVGLCGIRMGNTADLEISGRKNFESQNGKLTNNYIFNWSRYSPSYTYAIHDYSVGSTCSHNTMGHTVHSVLPITSLGGEISYNEMFDAVRDSADAGIIYGGRTWMFKSKVNNNLFRGGEQIGQHSDYVGIYLDDDISGVTMTNNIFENTKCVMSCAGKGNSFENNLIIGKAKTATTSIGVWERLQFENMRGYIQTELDQNKDWLAESDVWKAECPWIFDAVDENFVLKPDHYPPYVTIQNNILMNAAPMNICNSSKPYSTIVNNYETNTQLRFEDAKNGDYTLTEENLADFPGFEPIDFYSIGVQPSEYNSMTLVERRLKDCVVLDIDNPNALVDNEKQQIDKDDASVVPTIIDGRTLVPLRFIAEAFGAAVDWNGDTRTVTIKNDSVEIKMVIDQKNYTVNGIGKEMDVVAQVINGRTMVPLRMVSESLGKELFWDNDGLIIIGNCALQWDSTWDNYRIKTIFESLQ